MRPCALRRSARVIHRICLFSFQHAHNKLQSHDSWQGLRNCNEDSHVSLCTIVGLEEGYPWAVRWRARQPREGSAKATRRNIIPFVQLCPSFARPSEALQCPPQYFHCYPFESAQVTTPVSSPSPLAIDSYLHPSWPCSALGRPDGPWPQHRGTANVKPSRSLRHRCRASIFDTGDYHNWRTWKRGRASDMTCDINPLPSLVSLILIILASPRRFPSPPHPPHTSFIHTDLTPHST